MTSRRTKVGRSDNLQLQKLLHSHAGAAPLLYPTAWHAQRTHVRVAFAVWRLELAGLLGVCLVAGGGRALVCLLTAGPAGDKGGGSQPRW